MGCVQSQFDKVDQGVQVTDTPFNSVYEASCAGWGAGDQSGRLAQRKEILNNFPSFAGHRRARTGRCRGGHVEVCSRQAGTCTPSCCLCRLAHEPVNSDSCRASALLPWPCVSKSVVGTCKRPRCSPALPLQSSSGSMQRRAPPHRTPCPAPSRPQVLLCMTIATNNKRTKAQLEGLEELRAKYEDQGMVVMVFPWSVLQYRYQGAHRWGSAGSRSLRQWRGRVLPDCRPQQCTAAHLQFSLSATLLCCAAAATTLATSRRTRRPCGRPARRPATRGGSWSL